MKCVPNKWVHGGTKSSLVRSKGKTVSEAQGPSIGSSNIKQRLRRDELIGVKLQSIADPQMI